MQVMPELGDHENSDRVIHFFVHHSSRMQWLTPDDTCPPDHARLHGNQHSNCG